MTSSRSVLADLRRCLLACMLVLGPALAAHAQAKTGAIPAKPAAVAATGVVNVNTATQQELLLLPGIGPSRAAAILELRGKLNGFKKLEDLLRVKGIGRATLRKLEPMVRLTGATTMIPAEAKPKNVAAR